MSTSSLKVKILDLFIKLEQKDTKFNNKRTKSKLKWLNRAIDYRCDLYSPIKGRDIRTYMLL